MAYVISCQDYFMSWHDDIWYIVAALLRSSYYKHMHKQEDYSFTAVLNEIEEEFSEVNQQYCTHMLLSAYSLILAMVGMWSLCNF